MLTPGEIAGMRATVSDSLPDTCSILRRSLVVDGMGGNVATWLPAATLVPCRMAGAQGSSDTETEAQGRVTGETPWTLTLGWSVSILTTDRVVYQSRTYEVTNISSDRSWELGKRIGLRELV